MLREWHILNYPQLAPGHAGGFFLFAAETFGSGKTQFSEREDPPGGRADILHE
jgi:hypothetical protein